MRGSRGGDDGGDGGIEVLILSSADGPFRVRRGVRGCRRRDVRELFGKRHRFLARFSSTVPTHAYRPKTTQLSNQSSRLSLSRLLTLRVKYRVVLLRTMVPSSLSLPRWPYSMYSTGFWVSSLASEPILPSLRCASCPGKIVMYRDFLTLDRLWMSLQSLLRRSLEGTSSRMDDGRTRESCRPSTAASKISRLRLA